MRGAGVLMVVSGPSGSGKSTILRLIAGLEPVDAGEVRIGTLDQPFNPSRDIGMVFQQPLLLKAGYHHLCAFMFKKHQMQ